MKKIRSEIEKRNDFDVYTSTFLWCDLPITYSCTLKPIIKGHGLNRDKSKDAPDRSEIFLPEFKSSYVYYSNYSLDDLDTSAIWSIKRNEIRCPEVEDIEPILNEWIKLDHVKKGLMDWIFETTFIKDLKDI